MSRSSVMGAGLLFVLSACGDPRNDPKPEPRSGATTAASTSASGSAAPSAAASAAKKTKLGDQGEKALATLKLESMSDREREALIDHLDETLAPCADVPVSLGQCITEKRSCSACEPAAEFLARQVKSGMPRADRDKLFSLRFDPKEIKSFELKDVPTKGPEDAPVSIVEFADFECPACAGLRFLPELLIARFPGQVRVFYKVYALPNHMRAPEAALAAIAAQKQGKFWEMSELLFKNQETGLERKDLFAYSNTLRLDLAQFTKDFEDPETRKRLVASIEEGNAAGLGGTPTFFINGRFVPLEHLKPFLEELEAWIALDLKLAGKTPAEASPRYQEMLIELGAPPPTPAASNHTGVPSAQASAGAGSAQPSAPSAAPSSGAPSVGAPKK